MYEHDRQTDRQTLHEGIGCAYIALRSKKWFMSGPNLTCSQVHSCSVDICVMQENKEGVFIVFLVRNTVYITEHCSF